MVFALLATASLAALSPANEADLHCLTIFAITGSEAKEEKDSAGLVGAMMYYLGRIEGRSDAFDLEAQMTRLLTDPDYTQPKIEADAMRCGREMEQRGADLQKVGGALKNAGEARK